MGAITMTELPKLALGAWAWGDSANYFGNVMVRNEWFTLEENDGMKFSGTVVSKTFLGKTTRIKVKSDFSSSGMFCAEVETSKAQELSAGKNIVFYAENVVTF